MKSKLLVFSLILMFMLSACAKAAPQSEAVVEEQAYDGKIGYDAVAPNAAPEAPREEAAGSAGEVERLVIQNAYLRISVLDPAIAMKATASLANGLGGFVVSSETWTNSSSDGTSYTRSSITIRVPTEQLGFAMESIRQMAADGENGVLSESLSGQDVTSDYTDSKSRLRNLKAAEEQLLELMDQTTDVEDTMQVFRELTSIRGQIEVLEGHIQYLEESAALSSISVEFVAEASLQPIEIGGWKPQGVAREAIQRLIKSLQGVGNALIWFGLYCLPFLVPLGIAAYFVIKAIKKNRAKKAAKKILETPIE